MASTTFPYDTNSFDALARLLQEVKPTWNVNAKSVRFDNYRFVPTAAKPGRTFVDVHMLDQGISALFVYRRLDIGRAIGPEISLTVEAEDITSALIVEEINRLRDMRFSNHDVLVNDRVLKPVNGVVRYRMRARATSPVWYGETIVTVTAKQPDYPANLRLLEDGTPRRLEDGTFRVLEEA